MRQDSVQMGELVGRRRRRCCHSKIKVNIQARKLWLKVSLFFDEKDKVSRNAYFSKTGVSKSSTNRYFSRTEAPQGATRHKGAFKDPKGGVWKTYLH